MSEVASERETGVSALMAALCKASKNFGVPKRDLYNAHFGNWYSSLEACLDAVKLPLLEENLVLQQGIMRPPEGGDSVLIVFSRLWHGSIFIESTIPIPVIKNKSGSTTGQAIGSALTYGRRYSLKSLLALGDSEMEDDGNMASGLHDDDSDKPLGDEHCQQIEKMVKNSGADLGKFLEFLGVQSIQDLREKDYSRAIRALKEKIKAQQTRKG